MALWSLFRLLYPLFQTFLYTGRYCFAATCIFLESIYYIIWGFIEDRSGLTNRGAGLDYTPEEINKCINKITLETKEIRWTLYFLIYITAFVWWSLPCGTNCFNNLIYFMKRTKNLLSRWNKIVLLFMCFEFFWIWVLLIMVDKHWVTKQFIREHSNSSSCLLRAGLKLKCHTPLWGTSSLCMRAA